ncbi:hypothetical protein AAG906_029912 [Vitis piasezkii]
MADALLSASLQVLFYRLASAELINFIRAQKLSHELLTNFKRKLLVVHKALNDAEMKQFSDPLVKDWLVQVKDVVYHAEDLLDEIATDALRSQIEAADSQDSGTHQVWNWKKVSAWVKAPFASQSMESRVKGLISLLENIAQEKVELGLKEGEGEKLSPRSPSTSLVDESFVYGRNEIKEEMVKWLLSDKENATGNNIDVISIMGMGGSGKTTLAQLLYNHDRVKQHFHLKAWVCVSTEFFLIEEVTKSFLKEIGSETKSDDTLNLLQLKLKESVGNKKFLLVLDDVWDMKSLDWDGLRIPLLAAAEGSKIVVTSRSETAAKIMRAIRSHHLGTLSPEDSWSLFTKLAFPNGDSSAYPQLETIGREIVDKCQGLPLAVKALRSLLYSKADKREWEDILNSKTWHSQTDHEILPSFRLSYQHLSPPVKRCFAYCSIFAKDHEFDKKKLILLWMAEGLLHAGQRDERMEEVGESCFNELVAKSFFQKSITKESCFVIHDLIHDLAQHISGEFCVQLEHDDDRMVVFQKFEAVGEAKHLRTFLDEKKYPYFGFYTLRLREFPEIRGILKISNMENVVCVKDALQANMKDKRYLDELSLNWDEMISNDVIQSGAIDDIPNNYPGVTFPNWLGDPSFLNLGSLELSGCENCSTLPPLGQLPCLEHLEISNMKGVVRVGSRHGEFPRLQKLFMWSCRKLTGELLIHLPSLKKLYLDRCPQLLVPTLNVSAACGLHLKRQACGFTALQTSDIEISNVSQLKQLPVVPHNLFITKSDSVESLLEEEILQTNICHHPVLKRLWINGGTYDNSLRYSSQHWTSSQKLEGPNLVYIQLPTVNLMCHEISNCSKLRLLAYTHSSLQQLRLEDCPEVLFHGEGASKLTSLVKLWIMDCPELQSLTEAGLHHLTSLEILNIHKCPELQYLTKRDCMEETMDVS